MEHEPTEPVQLSNGRHGALHHAPRPTRPVPSDNPRQPHLQRAIIARREAARALARCWARRDRRNLDHMRAGARGAAERARNAPRTRGQKLNLCRHTKDVQARVSSVAARWRWERMRSPPPTAPPQHAGALPPRRRATARGARAGVACTALRRCVGGGGGGLAQSGVQISGAAARAARCRDTGRGDVP